MVTHFPIAFNRLVGEFGSEEDKGLFRSAVAKSVDDVVKDVGGKKAQSAIKKLVEGIEANKLVPR